jgi:hypothetical protein
LLGYLLDPEHPEHGDEDILRGLLNHFVVNSSFAHWVKHTYGLSGRWILIADDGRDVRMFTDAMGLRQVFYTDPALTAECWCATQPGLIADELNLEMDPVAVREYIDTPAFRAWPEYLFPADTSAYVEIRHLLPNHVLELNSRACTRYWPDGPIGALSLEESASVSAELLRRIMHCAAARFDLALGLSAGWDSRLVLAGSKEIADRIHVYTYAQENRVTELTIASRVLRKLGLTQHVVPVPPQMDADLAQLYDGSYTLAHAYTGRFLQALWNEVPAGKLKVTGNAAEITRVRMRLPKGETVVTPRSLARFMYKPFADQIEQIPFALGAWERWLAGVGHTHDVHVLDLFYWEYKAGGFAAIDQTEEDMALDTLTPFNCRLLLTRMLAAPEVFRDHDRPRLYEEMMRRLWPETLAVPVNPRRPMRLKTKIRLLARRVASAVAAPLLRALGVETAARDAYSRIRGRRRAK